MTINIKLDTEIYSPFSGRRSATDNGPNTRDKTLLFAFYGDSGEYGHISSRVRAAVATKKGEALEDLSPATLIKRLKMDNVIVFAVDTGWNGVNTIAFAPLEE